MKDMRYESLNWLYRMLKKKKIALGQTESKPNRTEAEIYNIQSQIEIIEWLIDTVMDVDCSIEESYTKDR